MSFRLAQKCRSAGLSSGDPGGHETLRVSLTIDLGPSEMYLCSAVHKSIWRSGNVTSLILNLDTKREESGNFFFLGITLSE